jgi:hypothetical protein
MKERICGVLMMCMLSAYSQDTIPNKSPVISIGIRNLYGVLPYNYCIGINTFNLKNSYHLAYNSFHNNKNNSLWRPGIQFGYTRNFFKKTGLILGLSYNYVKGDFSFYGDRAKYIGSTNFKNLEYLNLNLGLFHRFNLRKYGIIEPSITITYFSPIKSLHKEYFSHSTMPRLLPNLEIKYYFKRNKK